MIVQISIVIPMFNEELNVAPLFERLFAVLSELDYASEVIAVDDGSKDRTFALLSAQIEKYPSLRVLKLARNYGQHSAIIAGFEAARGEWIITIDADLQNPPEEIPKLVEQFEKGHDIVNTVRQMRQDTLFRRSASKLVNHLVRRWSGIVLNDFGCMLRGYHCQLIRSMLSQRFGKTFLPALGMIYATNPIEIPVAHASREQGESKYSLIKLIILQFDLVTGFSLAPLRLLFFSGLLLSALGVGNGLLLLALRLYYGSGWAVDGVFTLFALLFVFMGGQFFALGILGEYVGRIYEQVQGRARYQVAKELSLVESSL